MDPIIAAIAEAVERVLQEKLAGWPAQAQPEQLLLRVKDVAAMTGLSARTVRELIAKGELPTRDVDPYNCILVARSDLDRWVNSLPTRRGSHEQKTA